jgi:hypothetical protein
LSAGIANGVRGDHEKVRGIYLERLGIAATGVDARKSYTGVITVRGPAAR